MAWFSGRPAGWGNAANGREFFRQVRDGGKEEEGCCALRHEGLSGKRGKVVRPVQAGTERTDASGIRFAVCNGTVLEAAFCGQRSTVNGQRARSNRDA